MHSRREVLISGIAAGGALVFNKPGLAAGPIRSVIAISQVFSTDQKLIAVAVEFERAIDGARLTPASFAVAGRTVVAAYASAAANPHSRSQNGLFVIVELSADDAEASLIGRSGFKRVFKDARVVVTQTGTVYATNGQVYTANQQALTNTGVRHLIVDDFKLLSFKDDQTGDVLNYALFIPRNYNKAKSYPLVLFMHDRGSSSEDPRVTLTQGLGAVIWADPAEQAKRECLVLAPQYPGEVVNDASQATSMLDSTVHLVEAVARQYSVDRDRIYATGQSGGAMMSIAMNVKYPDLFAASYIVAGQWDPAVTRPLARDKLWIVVSEGDLKAYPGQNAITAVIEKEGTKVSRAVWDGRATPEQFAAAVAAMEAEKSPVNYVALKRGTVVPAGQPDNGGTNHINTWRIAYNIEGIRAWLFRQRR